ncbi:GDP-L-fucose synthase family protein [candidate division KSB1 bacterium]
MDKRSKIFIADVQKNIGSSIEKNLRSNGYSEIMTNISSELELTDQRSVNDFFNLEKPQFVFLAAGKSGGIQANIKYPADFIYDNLQIEINVIQAAYKSGVEKLLFLGSSCVYPKNTRQPIKEEYFLTGELEKTSEPYAVAKIAGMVMCQAYFKQFGRKFIVGVPATPYGQGDSFDPEHSHVLTALIRKFHEAKINNEKEIVLWGSGKPIREFIFIDDLAEACIFLMNNYDSSDIINVGSGSEIPIKKLAELIRSVIGFEGSVVFDDTKPDGAPKKVLDITEIKNIGWRPKVDLEKGIKLTYEEFLKKEDQT